MKGVERTGKLGREAEERNQMGSRLAPRVSARLGRDDDGFYGNISNLSPASGGEG